MMFNDWMIWGYLQFRKPPFGGDVVPSMRMAFAVEMVYS